MSGREAQETADRIVAKFEREHHLRLLAEAEVEQLRNENEWLRSSLRQAYHDQAWLGGSREPWKEADERLAAEAE